MGSDPCEEEVKRLNEVLKSSVNPSNKQPDKLFYYSKSADKPVGKGANELVANPVDYAELNKIGDWRRILSNFCAIPNGFTYDGHTFKTVEHAFQSKKIGLVDQQKAFTFTLESNTILSRGGGQMARGFGRKLVVLSKDKLKEWGRIKTQVMKDIMVARFMQDDVGRDVLLKTNSAQLHHIRPRQKSIRMIELECARAKVVELLSTK